MIFLGFCLGSYIADNFIAESQILLHLWVHYTLSISLLPKK